MVNKNKEKACCDFLNQGKTGFKVEAYVATQVVRKGRRDTGKVVQSERVVIPRKIFVRVDEPYRKAVMQQCPYIDKCLTNPKSRLDKEPRKTLFVRIPDWEIQRVRQILEHAAGPVEFSETIPEIHDNVTVIGGQLLKGSTSNGIKGEVVMVNGHKRATVILDGVGCLKWSIPISDLINPTKDK